jgi:serine/threonine-protein kinase
VVTTGSQQSQQTSLVGAVLSRKYKLVRLIGEGGMGAVYATDQAHDGAVVAVKILKPEFLADAQVLTRFLEEGKTCQRLIHPNILRVFDAAQAEDGSPYIVMELLDGVPLSAYTKNGGRVPAAQAATVLQGILAGLAAAHAQGIVHRDLKPENVFLSRDAAGQFHVKLVDFGIAKVMDAAGGMGKKTQTGMLLGTPAYMSPEQIKSAKDVDARADLWSAAVLFYEMLTGRVAFPAPTEYARLAAVLNTTPPPVEQVDPGLAPLGPFMAIAMSKDRAHRFQTALEMARALKEAIGAAEAPGSRVVPLSRLPEVPSLFAPSVVVHPSPGATSAPATAVVSPGDAAPTTGPGGTLASAPATASVGSQPPPPPVVIVQGGTLPSKDLPMLDPVSSGAPRLGRGVAPVVVVVLVMGALLAGFVLGYATGRM